VERLQKYLKAIEADATLRDYMAAETTYGQMLIEVQKVLVEMLNPDVPGPVQGSQG
jgi:cell fate (sporulation/competence/biofilm development) regulator YlbF (YheA/YmcA/DUF963 family)